MVITVSGSKTGRVQCSSTPILKIDYQFANSPRKVPVILFANLIIITIMVTIIIDYVAFNTILVNGYMVA